MSRATHNTTSNISTRGINMKIMFAGGGTAGHITPAVAMAKYIQKADKSNEIYFAGAKGGIEEKLIKHEGFKLYTYDITGLSRSLSPKGLWSNAKTLKHALASVGQAKKDLLALKPDIVVGTGGYACFPAVYAASKLGIKTAMLEVNAVPGVAVKYLAGMVDCVMISFESTRAQIKKAKKIVHTGSPVRDDVVFSKSADTKMQIFGNEKPLVLSFWGSVGAQYMNEKMIEFMEMAQADASFNQMHAAGSANFKWMPDRARERGVRLGSGANTQIDEYIYDMGSRMHDADLIICRGGAGTLSEICAAGKPAIIVPSPYVTDNHQEKNAREIEKGGGAIVIKELECTPQILFDEVKRLLGDTKLLMQMGRATQNMAVLDGDQKIYDTIKELLVNSTI